MYYEIAGTNIRVLGSMHLFPSTNSQLPEWAKAAYEWSEEIETEHNLPEFASIFAQDFQASRPWALLFSRFGESIRQANLAPGLEARFAAMLSQQGKPSFTHIETARSVVDLLDAVPAADLQAATSRFDKQENEMLQIFTGMHDAWERSDAAALIDFQRRGPMGSTPALLDAMLTKRNWSWAKAIATRGRARRRKLIVIGALHLVGEGSLLDQLQARGFKVNLVSG